MTNEEYNDYCYRNYNVETMRQEDGTFISKVYNDQMEYDMTPCSSMSEAESAAGNWIDNNLETGRNMGDNEPFGAEDDFEDTGMSYSQQCYADRSDYAQQFSCPIQQAEIRMGA